jgi:hypothetical protein
MDTKGIGQKLKTAYAEIREIFIYNKINKKEKKRE